MEQQTIIDKDFMSVILSVSQNINVKWSYKKTDSLKCGISLPELID